jgi:nucleotide-binding universal stress UspA family protein
VNIKSMLVRLGCAMNRTDLFEQMMLLPEPVSQKHNSDKPINLVVGYNASHRSRTALDLTLWIAHQSRLATQKQVTVQVVYVMAEKPAIPSLQSANINDLLIDQFSRQTLKSSVSNKSTTSVLTKPKSQQLVETSRQTSQKIHTAQTIATKSKSLKQAEQILAQACCLAEEWGGDFKTHLRFGDVVKELRGVVESTSATALLLGCNEHNHEILQKIGYSFPCSILGIPDGLN